MNMTQLSKAEKLIYLDAQKALADGIDTASFTLRYFGPDSDLANLTTTREQREKLVRSALYKWLQAQATKLRQKDVESFEKEVQACSGRLTVVVPRSLHASLKREATWEGVSMSELIRLKLGVPYRIVTRQAVNV